METTRLERVLDAGHRWSLFDYEDAQCEFPERLVAEWLTEAIDAGAIVRNHCGSAGRDVTQGRARGVLLRDRIQQKISASTPPGSSTVPAPGPIASAPRSSFARQALLGGVRGSHIVLPRFSGSPNAALYTEAADGRPVFIIPWNDQIIVGTTEVADADDPAQSCPVQRGD